MWPLACYLHYKVYEGPFLRFYLVVFFSWFCSCGLRKLGLGLDPPHVFFKCTPKGNSVYETSYVGNKEMKTQ